MYVATGLGATEKRCLSDEQAAEAVRLCNCKRYGWPEGPVRGVGQVPEITVDFGQTNISIDLDKGKKGAADPCAPTPRVAMPKDFNPKDPCEGASRITCKQKQRREIDEARKRQEKKREQRKNEEARSYEEEFVDQTWRRKKLLVGGILTAVLVGAGLVVYRSTRKG